MSDPVEEYRRRVYQKLNLKIKPGMKVLDLGCGDGYDSAFFAQKGAVIVGVDETKSFKWQGFKVRFPKLSFLVGNAENLPLPSGSFDLVFAKDVLHHTKNPQKLLGEALRLTKGEGKVISLEANRYNPLLYFHMTLLRGHQHLKRKDFKNIISEVKGENKVRFFEFEAHVFPFPGWLRKICYFFQNWLEKTLFWRPFLSYNGAVIQKGA
jgi:ubiquinone/menaquinone biosynthesis C-methylase UbiE